MSYSKQIANLVMSCLDNQELNYDFNQEDGIIRFSISNAGKLKNIRFIIGIWDSDYVVFASIDLNADKDVQAEMCDFMTRVNYAIKFGNFEMDHRDGEIRFRVAVDCDDCTPSEEVIKNSLYIPLMMYRDYGDALLSVLFGMKTGAEAFEDARGE
ncbi:MAG: YbjN domain-containing protein [Oscillibacter sp.]|nr:YbjN domain-containing protein [Oscillibacter sp.]